MTTASSSLQSIFAAPFASVRLAQPDGLNLALAAGLNPLATAAQGDATLPTDRFCYRSREDLFEWQGDALSYLKQELLAGLCGVVRAANLYTEEQFRALGIQAKARFVIVRPNGCLPAGSLPHASWCAIYCVSAPDPNPLRPDSATLRLYSHRFGGMFLDSANWNLRQPVSLRAPSVASHSRRYGSFSGLDPARSGPESRRSRPDADYCPRPLRRSPSGRPDAAPMVSPGADDPALLRVRGALRGDLSDRP